MESVLQPIVVTGMHRSGTSLMTSLLQKSGLNLGSNLMEPNSGNIRGYFEDWDFVHFHEDVLQSQGISKEGWTLTPAVQVQNQLLPRAKELIRKKQDSGVTWGWKDPRTTLFLNFWVEQLPEATFLLLYRSPWEVIDSLYRRGDIAFNYNPNFALQVWSNYNQVIVEFYDRFPEQSILINTHLAVEYFNLIIDEINKKSSLGLSNLDKIDDIYEKSLLNKSLDSNHRPILIKHFFSEAIELYQDLFKRDYILKTVPTRIEDNLQLEGSIKTWILQDWRDLRRLEQQIQATEELLQQTQQEKQATEEFLQQTQQEKQATEEFLQQTQAIQKELENELHQKINLLNQIREELITTQTEWENSLNQYEKIIQEHQNLLQKNQQLQSVITAMESSKFWQLRKIWFTVKKILGFGWEKFSPLENMKSKTYQWEEAQIQLKKVQTELEQTQHRA